MGNTVIIFTTITTLTQYVDYQRKVKISLKKYNEKIHPLTFVYEDVKRLFLQYTNLFQLMNDFSTVIVLIKKTL